MDKPEVHDIIYFLAYGWWPASGEIDIFEGRGQTPTHIQSGWFFLFRLSHWIANQN
jgi:hypothetical protein